MNNPKNPSVADWPDWKTKLMQDFEINGDKPGQRMTINDVGNLEGKELQESYRTGLPKNAGTFTEKVTGR